MRSSNADERTAFEVSSKALSQSLAVYKKDLEALKKSLETRKNNLFQPTALKTPAHDANEIAKHVADINALIGTSNSKTATLEKDKTATRDALRLADVFAFADAITYNKELSRNGQRREGSIRRPSGWQRSDRIAPLDVRP